MHLPPPRPVALSLRPPGKLKVVVSAPTSVCLRTTGFTEAAHATDAMAWLERHGATVVLRQMLSEVVKDHWVFHRPLPTRAAAVAMMEEMRAHGVEDIAVIRHGDLANGISLGLYRSTDNMVRRIAALEAMGYAVQYETTLKTVTSYGLDAEFAMFSRIHARGLGSRVPRAAPGGFRL